MGGKKVLTKENIVKFILGKYLKSGLEFIKHLRGYFNIIIIDKKQVFLINDQLGLSPMYIYQTEEGIFFCNEPEPIIWLNIANNIDYNSIAEFIVYGFVINGKTFIKNLYNQPPGSILHFDDNKMRSETYFDFMPMDVSGMSEKKKFQLVKDVFLESVQIRINKNTEDTFLDLTGGWDTRFILANMLHLNKKPILYTKLEINEDLEIAKMLAKEKRLKHIIQDFPSNLETNPRLFLDLNYQKKVVYNFYIQNKKAFHDCFEHITSSHFYFLPKFSGLYGGELLGNTPDWFDKRIKLNLAISGKKLLSHKLFRKAIKNKTFNELLDHIDKSASPVYLFLTHIGRTYLNVHYTAGWERPTAFFADNTMIPFTDLKFISLLCSFDYNKYIHRHKLYEILYKAYYPEYLEFPWTNTPLRRKNELKNVPTGRINSESFSYTTFLDKRFISFLNQSNLTKDANTAKIRAKELFFLFNWFNIYKSVLKPSDVDFCVGDSLN